MNIESIRELHSEIYLDLEEKISDIRLVSSIEQCISEIFAKNVRIRPFLLFIDMSSTQTSVTCRRSGCGIM